MDLSSLTENFFATASPTFSSTLTGDVDTGDTTIGITSLAAYNDGDVVTLAIAPKTANQQIVTGVVALSTNELTNCVWTEADETITHSGGTAIRDIISATHFAAMTKGLLQTLNQDGTIKDNAVTNAMLANQAWEDFTPTFTGTGFSKGNGITIGRKYRVGKTVIFWAKLIFGSSTSMTTSGNELKFTLPETAKASDEETDAASYIKPIGNITFLAGGLYWHGTLMMNSTTQATPHMSVVSGSYAGQARGLDVTNIGNVAGHTLSITGIYEVAQ